MPIPLKIILWIVGIFLVIVIIGIIMRIVFYSPSFDVVRDIDKTSYSESELKQYFEEGIDGRAERSGILPHTEYDAEMLLRTFPGLQEEDFINVETREGYYHYENGRLEFSRNDDAIPKSERIISDDGYVTLLRNVSSRLNVPVRDLSDIDTIIMKIGGVDAFGSTYGVRINEQLVEQGVTITPRTLLEDSRCPIDVDCIQAGTVRLRAELTNEYENDVQILSLGETSTTILGDITLVAVEPDPVATDLIDPSTYTFFFRIEPRTISDYR